MNALDRAYGEYMHDDRASTDDDREAFNDAIFRYIIGPVEEIMDNLSSLVEKRFDDAQADIDDSHRELLALLGVD